MYKTTVYAILSKILEQDKRFIEDFSVYESLTNIGLDSMHFIKLIVELENFFNIEFRDSDLTINKFSTISNILQTLEKYVEHKETLKKVVISDCDNVLWLGVAGEEKLQLDDLCISYQEKLIELYDKGVLLCLCSKNTAQNIEDAFDSLDMVLCKEHIASERINWIDKATNIKTLSKELNLSIDSFVFVDDSDYELGLVASILPEITTIKADREDTLWIDYLDSLFNLNQNSMDRTRQYKEQKEREKQRTKFNSVVEYNESLLTETICEIATLQHAERISELSLRTNQFNLSAKRYTVESVTKLINDPNYRVIILSASDKYGDMGIIACAVIDIERATIDAFMLSCRGFNRGFEHILLDEVKITCKNQNVSGIISINEKNERFSDFYTINGIKVV